MERESFARLGLAVLQQAARDMTSMSRALSSADRDEARAFLAGGPALSFWADVAGLRVDQVRRMFAAERMSR